MLVGALGQRPHGPLVRCRPRRVYLSPGIATAMADGYRSALERSGGGGLLAAIPRQPVRAGRPTGAIYLRGGQAFTGG